jgi:hypothetical protein
VQTELSDTPTPTGVGYSYSFAWVLGGTLGAGEFSPTLFLCPKVNKIYLNNIWQTAILRNVV